MTEETVLPNLSLSRYCFLLSLPHYNKKEEIKKTLLEEVRKNNMVQFYKELCEQFKWPVDTTFVEKANTENAETLKKLEEKIADAIQNLGETEVRETHLEKANFLLKIGDKEEAEKAYRATSEKTVGLGQRLDIVFTLLRMGFFYNDKDLVARNIEKAESMIEEGGDWDRRNRLKVYKAYYLMNIRDFATSAELFSSTLPSFSAEELFDFTKDVFYTVICSIVSCDRITLKKNVVDSPEVLTVIGKMPHLRDLLTSFYDSDYKIFFRELAVITDMLKEEQFLSEHVSYFSREMRVRAYKQFLQSYSSVQIQSMASAFGVTEEYIDRELSRFISSGRLNCKLDAIDGVIEAIHPDTKNAQYLQMIKYGDLLMNRVQKLSRVIHL
jgi:26S proteasome regulatory subunit N7